MGNVEVICSGCNAVVHWSEAECNSEAADAEWLCSDCQDAAELEWYREREGRVHDLLTALDAVDVDKISDAIGIGFGPVLDAMERVRDFKKGEP